MSLYEYCRSGPLGATDPQGLIGGDTPDQLQRVYEDQIRRAGEDIAETQRLSASGALAPAWITSQRASMHFTLGVLARSLGGFMDYVDPLRRLERGQADFEAEMRRRRVPNEDDDAMVIAIGKNWPVIDILWQGLEGVAGEGIGGVSHGRALSGVDRFVNITGVIVLASATGWDWCAKTGYNPTLWRGRAASKVTPGQATTAADAAKGLANANKLNHIFGNPAHGLDGLVKQFGSEQAAYQAIQQATEVTVKAQRITGLFRTKVRVGPETITVKGKVINGTVKIGTAHK
jgi:hypothetical protein